MSNWFTDRAWSLWGKKIPKIAEETNRLLGEAAAAREKSKLKTLDPAKLALVWAEDGASQSGVDLPLRLKVAVALSCLDLFDEAGFTHIPRDVRDLDPESFKAKLLRDYARMQIKFHASPEQSLALLERVFEASASHIFGRLRLNSALSSILGAEDGVAVEQEGLSLRLIDFIDDVSGMVEGIAAPFFTEEVRHHGMFQVTRDIFDFNLARASGLNPDQKHLIDPKKIITPSRSGLNSEELVEVYLNEMPFQALFDEPIPIELPDAVRFEHTHILGGSGHGKTQLMSQLILRDIKRAKTERRSIIVMDSQGDLISKILRLAEVQGSELRDRLVIIDPTEFERPIAINPFSLDEARLNSYSAAEREQFVYSAISLFEYFFGELLGSELTGQQGMVFKFLIRLLVEIPGATLITLRDLMDDPRPFESYMNKLQGSARIFFEREFMSKGYASTRKQISRRLWAVLSNPVFERLFSSPVNKLDWFHLMQDGRIILINTAKDFLKADGSRLLGRFLSAQIAHGVLERAAIPEGERTPTFFYIDEAHDQIDPSIEMLLSQGRKYKLGLTLAHQYLGQLSPSQRANLKSNTSLKFAGGLSLEDARSMAGDMRCDPNFLLSMRKQASETRFALAMRNQIDRAVPLSVPLGVIDREPAVPDEVVRLSLQANRHRYGRDWGWEPGSGSNDAPSESAAGTIVADLDKRVEQIDDLPGRGSAKHRSEQERIRNLGANLGYLSEVEKTLENGLGAVDVLLSNDRVQIAVEISTTTSVEHEFQNIQKCLSAGVDYVVMTANDRHRLKTIEDEAWRSLPAADCPKVLFLVPQEIEGLLGSHSSEPYKNTIMGYRVIVNNVPSSSEEKRRRLERLEWLVTQYRVRP